MSFVFAGAPSYGVLAIVVDVYVDNWIGLILLTPFIFTTVIFQVPTLLIAIHKDSISQHSAIIPLASVGASTNTAWSSQIPAPEANPIAVSVI